MHSTTAACCLSIVLDSSEFHTIRLSLFILDFLRQGTHQTVVHTTSLESHHPEDLPEPPSYVATSSELIMLCSPCFDKSRLGRSIAPPLPKKQFCSLGSPYTLDFRPDGSIIIPSACHGLLCICLTKSES